MTGKDNVLRVGDPRLCYLIDGDPDTPEAVVMLQNTGHSIEATFSLSGKQDGPYDRWWSRHVWFADDPDRNRHSYNPPGVLLLYDSLGLVALVGCRAAGWRRSVGHAGMGVVVADCAVLGAENLKYDRINGMRTVSPAIDEWVGGSTISTDRETDGSGRLQSMTLELKRSEPQPVTRKLNMTMQRHWMCIPAEEGYDVREPLVFQTLVRRPREWEEHLKLHIEVLDLVSIAGWKNCAFTEVTVSRTDDPLRTLDGVAHGEHWLTSITHALPGDDTSDCRGRFLFAYDDMASDGLSRWFRLRDDYGRAVDYLLRILRSGVTWSQQSEIMSGIALEQLGYLIDVKKNGGLHLNSRGQIHFKDALEVILADMSATPFETDDKAKTWVEACRDVYQGSKHADREEPSQLTRLNTLRENLLVLRFWIAQQLGVSGDVLERGLKVDPLRSRFELRDS